MPAGVRTTPVMQPDSMHPADTPVGEDRRRSSGLAVSSRFLLDFWPNMRSVPGRIALPRRHRAQLGAHPLGAHGCAGPRAGPVAGLTQNMPFTPAALLVVLNVVIHPMVWCRGSARHRAGPPGAGL